ncbi:LamG-like jellyroll fold domain-containing protein [Sorangium sp. So ce233]|uniref:LamG-like jellyroll fold domain-containing protein n=1 Tax=Sorangium sp. So ce233 TaxID=3133290 RepID=UPI003F608CD1
MSFSGQSINHLSTVTHDGKVVCFGTDASGTIWYTVKRSGFEDAALQDGADPFGFEASKKLRLGESVTDASVIAHEKENLAAEGGDVLVRTVYGASDEVTRSADAPVQVVSALNHLFVFRQSPGGKILVSRFVLDGMTNELVPKLEVRFRRSRQRLKAAPSAAGKGGGSFDNLDYRDIDGNYFYEGAAELSFAGTVANGWFSPVFAPTAESDRHRWHLFVHDKAAGKLVLYTIGSQEERVFDVKDYLLDRQDPSNPKNTIYRSLPGIVRRTLDLPGWTVVGAPTATTYDLQKEQITDAGPQLLRDTTRVMLAVPVKAVSSDVVKTAVLDFALAADGTLSQIDLTPDSSEILRSEAREVLTPLSLLDDIKEMADTTPPPSGTIVGTERGGDDLLQIRSSGALPAGVVRGAKVKIRGTQSYDGHYKVVSVKDATFQVEATFTDNQAGFWEIVPDKQTGLVFDNMVVGTAKDAQGKLMVACAAHDLKPGDEVQISGTQSYDGIFPVKSVVAGKSAFVLDTPFFAGEAANLSKVVRRGLRMDGDDRVETPELELVPPSPARDLGRTLSAWVRVDATGGLEQSLVKDGGGMMHLALGADNKVKLVVRMSDGATRTVTDPKALPADTWVHLAGTVAYATKTGGDTRIALCRDGVEVAQQTVARALPCHLGQSCAVFDGVDDYIEVPPLGQKFAGGVTAEAWVYLDKPAEASSLRGIVGQDFSAGLVQFALHVEGADHQLRAGFYDGTTWHAILDDEGLPLDRWVHVAATYDGHRLAVYRDGVLIKRSDDMNRPLPDKDAAGWRIGRRHDLGDAANLWKGRIADVRLWSRARTQAEIAEGMAKRLTGGEPGLVGYWPLDQGTANDLSRAKRHGTLAGQLAWKPDAYLHPQIVPPAAPGAKLARTMKLDGVDDSIEVPAYATPSSAITVSVWARSAAAAWSGQGSLVSKRDSFVLNPSKGSRDVEFGLWLDGAYTSVSGAPADVQGWHLYTGTYDGSEIRLYIDGEPAAQKAASGAIAADASGVMCIGHDDGHPATERNVSGQVADVQVWSVARAKADIRADMYRRLTGNEGGLVGYWPLDVNAGDLSPSKRNGAFKGSPTLVSAGSAHTIGEAFRGEISGVQIWEEARAAAAIKASMHLNLSGREAGLAAYYRMGAIAHEEKSPILPDFSRHGRNAAVYGDPYAGARRLNRATGSGKKVVQYGSDELVAVSQRGVYEETFEFRVSSPGAALDPNNAGGTGVRLFAFSYWGKSSRGSKEILRVPAGSVQQSDFESLGGGWYKASCRVVVPDGMSLLRAFEIADVRGKWGTESSPPGDEWTAIQVRKHRIRLVSDAVTRDSYTDASKLSSLPAQKQELFDNLAAEAVAEAKVAGVEARIRDLLARIDVAKNQQRYVDEAARLKDRLAKRASDRAAVEGERDTIKSSRWSYYQRILNLGSGKDMTAGDDGRVYQHHPWASTHQAYQRWRFVPGDGGFFQILQQKRRLALSVPGGGGQDTDLWIESPSNSAHMQWWLEFLDVSRSYCYLKPRHQGHLYAEIAKEATHDGAACQLWVAKHGNHQKWHILKTDEMTAEDKEALEGKDSALKELDKEVAQMNGRMAWLNEILARKESLDQLQRDLTTAQGDLTTARSDLATKDAKAVSSLASLPPAIMPVIATDERGLTTAGAVLDFVQPTGGVRLTESCEGNVLLTYVDRQGRMRATRYDAAADARNATFEQWLTDPARACAAVRDSGDKITLAKAVSLPATGWTCEAWVHFPMATRDDGSPYGTNVVASTGASSDAPLVVRAGSRLGLMIDGWYFDSGAHLERIIKAGWHHVAVASSRGTSTVYVDGEAAGRRTTSQPALRFNGTTDYVEVPAHKNPTTALTVSIWARSATEHWNAPGCLVCKRDAFIMHPIRNSKELRFYLWTNAGLKEVSFTPEDIQGWHLYTGTFDGGYIRLYIDGELAAEQAVTATIEESQGAMYIGYDNGNNGYFKGDIAEVSVWSSARTFTEIREDFYRSFAGNESDLIGYWRMNGAHDGGVTKVKDLTSNARHGLVKGAPADATITTLAARTLDVQVLGNLAKGGSPIGRFAEVRLWNLGLTDAEVAASARASLSGNEPGLVGYWPLDEATGATARDRSAGGEAHGAMVGVDWVGYTAHMGHPAGGSLNLPAGGNAYIKLAPIAPAGGSFTFECWARRQGGGSGAAFLVVATGAGTSGAFAFAFAADKLMMILKGPLQSPLAYTDTDWHHLCCTYDQPTGTRRLYRDGEVIAQDTTTSDLVASAVTIGGVVGGSHQVSNPFHGDIAEVRIWDKARTADEIRADMRRRLAGTEANLLACYPLDAVSSDRKVWDRKSGRYQGVLNGGAQLVTTTPAQLAPAMPPPVSPGASLVTAEYSSIEIGAEGKRRALMRRFFGVAAGGDVKLLPELRVEELTLQWIGNTQINPTLLGYIEGAPPVPSENLTGEYQDYDAATTVALKQSQETSYRWQRSEAQNAAFNLDGFLGAAWDTEAGLLISSKISEGQAGGVFNYAFQKSDTKDTAIAASSSITATDSLALSGVAEDKISCAAVGRRWVPKNVGYALVISGMADVFVTRLRRSGRMVSYDIRPVEGVPLDVNTITFLINPAYTLNGSLDGMVGSMPADPTFYPHVPDMRAQYGSLYPASYFRLKQAYALKDTIERFDKERESFFYNFSADQVEKLDAFNTPSAPSLAQGSPETSSKATDADLDALKQQSEKKKKELQREAERRKADIDAKHKSLEGRVRASGAFSDWQHRMAGIQTKAGKRNIVNTYVWDGDGGLRAEEQGFASTIEHSISTETSHSGGGGFSSEASIYAFKYSISLVGSGGRVDANSKTLSTSKALELSVDLSGVEKKGISDARDNPLVPGEKVDRYRFMTFYLEGSTDHFSDFFSYVVDPEWLMSNDEEARALRQAQAGRPNPCWRVLHRVTYVERPALSGFGRDVRALAPAGTAAVVTDYFAELERKQQAFDVRLGNMEDQLARIVAKLGA